MSLKKLQKYLLQIAVLCCVVFFSFAYADDVNLYPDLWAACCVGNFKEVKRIVRKGADVDQRDGSGSTALIHACFSGNTDIIKFLIQNGAMINITERSMGLSPLSVSAANGHKSAVIVLLDKGATDIDSAISMAEKFGHQDIVHLLNAKR